MEEDPEIAAKANTNSLVDIVFSWSLDDVLNKDLYKYKVKYIPKSFSSISDCLNCFIIPLIEETRADVCSSMNNVSVAPIQQISDIEIGDDYQPPDKLVCTIDLEMSCSEGAIEQHEPETGDLIAITAVRPECLSDFNRPNLSYLIAYVQRVSKMQDPDGYRVTIRLSKPIPSEVFNPEKGLLVTTYAVFLSNLTTNIRIWKALNTQLGDGSFSIIRNILQADPIVSQNCAICFHGERKWIEASSTGGLIRSLDLNESQEGAVMSCVALRDCSHKSTVKLIWGPPGTGKTKTVSSFLFALLKLKSKVVTCAPTNIAVVEVAKRLLKLGAKSFDFGGHGLGDIILYGNAKRMKIDDHDDLLDIFLDFRVHMLNMCLLPSSGWVHCLESIISLLENPKEQYRLFLEKGSNKDDSDQHASFLEEMNGPDSITEAPENFISSEYKRRTWKEIVAETVGGGKKKQKLGKVVNQQQKGFKSKAYVRSGDFSDGKLTFEEYVKMHFLSLRNRIKFYVPILYTHLPTSLVSSKLVGSMIKSIHLLENFSPFFCSGTGFNSETDRMKNECLQSLKSLLKRLELPDVHGKSEIRKFCLRNGCLFFCTASGSIKLHDDGPKRLQLVVIDEAAQLKECESSIPLQLPGLHHAILIGDERQLPAMVKSKVSEKAEFGRSLFERLVSLKYERHLLNVQYRMHPQISLFPNLEFYQKQILDAPVVAKRSYKKHLLPGSMHGTYSFINVTSGQEDSDDGNSLKNVVEVAVVCDIVNRLIQEVNTRGERISLGIISPYKAQVNAIEQKLKENKSMDTNENLSVRVRSVDGFQGGEEDVIIISTVRCNPTGLVGFLSDCRRTNVALTRARCCLWIVGNGETLINSDTVWKNLVVDAKTRGCFFDAEEDDSLAHVTALASLELYPLDALLGENSILFKKSRWKVILDEKFRQTIARIGKTTLRKEILSLVSKLSCGWRKTDGERFLSFKNGVPKVLEYVQVAGTHFLVWSVDIIEESSKYVQILKVWDVLSMSEIPKLVNCLNAIFSTYSEDHLYCCKFRCCKGNLEVPMTWPIVSYARGNYLTLLDFMEKLTKKLALLTLND